MAQEKRDPRETRDITVRQYIENYTKTTGGGPSTDQVRAYEKNLVEKILPQVYEKGK